MLETILTLSDTINYTFYEKIDVFKNHNPYFAQVSTVTLLKSSLADFFLLFLPIAFYSLRMIPETTFPKLQCKLD